MTKSPLLSSLGGLPKAGDAAGVERGIARWLGASATVDDGSFQSFAADFAAEPRGRALLEAVFGNSPFLSQCLLNEPLFFRRLVETGFEAAFAEILSALKAPDFAAAERPRLAEGLRRAKRRAALLVGLADISNAWPLERVMSSLSDFAEDALGAAVDHLLLGAARNGEIRLADEERSHRRSGFAVIGIGKLGARELNYSSDIDLMVLYDGETVICEGGDDAQSVFVRLTRELVRVMEERTAEGYVFRTDLRLRPDPGATPVALSMAAAESYYESVGQNWERAAMIKARPVAGDIEAGQRFLEHLVPFIWRRHLDFYALEDIHSIKRQIHAHRGHHEIAIAGHDIKLGRGGIREIELFTQTQQLIWGGRDPRLRSPATCAALQALAESGRIDAQACDDLIAAYGYLRRVEHRLQMIADEQTHTLPKTEPEIAGFACFMGHSDVASFERELAEALTRVEKHYAALFETAADLGGPGNLVFTGAEDDPETLTTLTRMGFHDSASVADVVRGWHRGRTRATRTKRAREILTELMPILLATLAHTVNPDAAFMRFNDFLTRLPTGIQIFSLFHANPALLELVGQIMGSAPRLAEHLSRKPALLDAVLNADFLEPLPGAEALRQQLEEEFTRARDFQDVLDIARRWAHDRQFQVGVQMLRNITRGDAAAGALSDIADAVVTSLQPRIEGEFARQYGRVAGGALAIVALGKLGGREMTIESDLDLVFVYDAADLLANSDGSKPLVAGLYFARLSQRFLNALKAPTAEGVLYTIDLRLRPSGNAGPLASEIDAFENYQREQAWTWEHMALTRARILNAPPGLRARLEALIVEVLTRPRDADRLAEEVAEMRAKVAAEHGTDNPWRLKQVRGGLLDLDFIAQFLELRDAHRHPAVLTGNTAGAFAALEAAGSLAPDQARELVEATRFLRRLQGLLRLTVGENRDEEQFPEGLRDSLVETGEALDFPALRKKLLDVEARVREAFARLIGAPNE